VPETGQEGSRATLLVTEARTMGPVGIGVAGIGEPVVATIIFILKPEVLGR
jgi:hypothetical protein